MPVDFSALVLLPAMNTFAILESNIECDPVTSRPGAAPYPMRGIFTTTELDVVGLDGGIVSDQKTTLGIRLAEFITGPPPDRRDHVTIKGVRYFIDDMHHDGQGGAVLTLRLLEPDYPK